MKISWVAIIETEKGTAKVGIRKCEDGKFEVVGKLPDGTIEDTDQIDDTYEMALDSIGIMFRGDTWKLWKLQWIDNPSSEVF